MNLFGNRADDGSILGLTSGRAPHGLRDLATADGALFGEGLLPEDRWTPSLPSLPLRESGSFATPKRDDEAAREGWWLPEGERAHCAVAGCTAQMKFWKRSGRPVFEGMWACERGCAKKIVAASIRRQMANAIDAPVAPVHRHRIPLGLVLLDRGVITHLQLRQALEAQRAAGYGRIGDWIITLFGVSEEEIMRAVGIQWNRPVLSLGDFAAEAMALVMPEDLRAQLRVLPLRVAARKILYVAFENEMNAAAVAAIERMSGLRVEGGLLAKEEFNRAAEQIAAARSVRVSEDRVRDTNQLAELVVEELWREQPMASRLVAVQGTWWLRMWLERGAAAAQGMLPATGEDVVDVLFRR